MKRMGKLFFLFSVLCLAPALVFAQSDCPAIVQQALAATDKACETTGRNQACYGNILLQATPREGASNFTFDKPGTLVNVTDVQTLTLSPMDTAKQEWGVAELKLQANLPDTLPGQNVMVLMFGNVEITDKAGNTPPPVLLNVTVPKTVNVRGEPSTKGAKVGSLAAQQTLVADGRTDAGDWLRVQLDGGKVGWVSAALVTVDGDVNTLPVKDASDTTPVAAAPALKPMQAFYFKSGVGDAPCKEAPDSGILIQSPKGAGKVDLKINEVDIELGSTIYVQAQPGGEMTINVLEGQITATAQGSSVIAPAGARVRIPLDASGVASGAPIGPEPYSDADLAAVPVSHLDEKIGVAKALTSDQLAAFLVPTPGIWRTIVISDSCGASSPPAPPYPIRVKSDGTSFVINNVEHLRTEPGVYHATVTPTIEVVMRVQSPTHITYTSMYTSGTQKCVSKGNLELVQADPSLAFP